jgi:3-phosphoshikimate 1-carboxyvinyltransferase
MGTTFPDTLSILPLDHPLRGRIRVPGSKSLTNRALVLAALASSHSFGNATLLTGALRSEDTEVMIECLGRLGIPVACDWPAAQLTLPVTRGKIPAGGADLFVANSGTTMRFLTALVCLGHGRFRLDGVPRMRERPIQDLLDALRQLGVQIRSEADNGCPPVVVDADGLSGGRVHIRGDVSSQFLSGLLMAAPLARDEIVIEVEGPLVSWPYVAMTVELMWQFGVSVDMMARRTFRIPGGQRYLARALPIEPDASAASYFAGAAAITGGAVELPDLTSNSLQGDIRFLDVLEDMGCRVEGGQAGIFVEGAALHGITVDMNEISDTVMTLAAVACFADGPTTIRNVAHIRHKETDRLAALATELRRVGAGVEEFADGMTIVPQPLHGAEIETYNDHRMAMSLALVGLKVPGVVIKNPACVAKTYPDFFADLEKLRCS